MNDDTKMMISTIICFAIIGATIVGSVYFAYNPKICPLGEQNQGYGE
ncbi:MAG: hypothetical protein ABW128_06955 [Rhizorhabdus sp.]